MSSQLVDQARYWEQRDRNDIAANLWRKLLRTDPEHPEALLKLGLIEARSGNIKEAKAIYNRATRLEKPPVGLNQLYVALGAEQASLKNLYPSTAKLETAKPAKTSIEESVKIDINKRNEATSVHPAAISLKKNAATHLSPIPPATRQINTKPGVSTGNSDLKLKFDSSIDIHNLIRQP